MTEKMASEFERYHGFTICFYIEAVDGHPSPDFAAFSLMLVNQPPGSVLQHIVPDPAHRDSVPRFWLGDVVSHRGLVNWQFEIRTVVPQNSTAEAHLNALADALEPHGWGLSNYPRGAIHKQEESRRKLRAEHMGKLGGLTGKPIY